MIYVVSGGHLRNSSQYVICQLYQGLYGNIGTAVCGRAASNPGDVGVPECREKHISKY